MAQVLIVDDDTPLRMGLREVLESEGHTIYGEAEDGRAALTKLRASPHPLVVVMSNIMPGMSGLAMLDIVAADPVFSTRHVYIMVTGSNVKDALVLRQLDIPHLPKPVDLDELFDAIAEVARRLPSEN